MYETVKEEKYLKRFFYFEKKLRWYKKEVKVVR